MDIWGGEKIVFSAPQPCSICRRNLAYQGWRFDGEQVIVSVCGTCSTSWPLSKIVDKMNSQMKPKIPLRSGGMDFRPRQVAPLR